LLEAFAASASIPVACTREPGGTVLGEKLRRMLIDPTGVMTAEAETLLVNAARAELVDKVIEPALADGRLVLCDRFWDATIAYQGFGRGVALEALLPLIMFAARRLCPDLTILLELPVSVSRRRLGRRSDVADRIEAESVAFHERVAHGYRRLAAAQAQRFVRLDATRPKPDIAQEIQQLILARWLARPHS